MRAKAAMFVGLVVVVCGCASSRGPAARPDGEWLVDAVAGGKDVAFLLHVVPKEGRLEATADILPNRGRNVAVDGFTAAGSVLSFRLPVDAGQMEFTGRLDARGGVGRTTLGGSSGTFAMRRLREPSELAEVAGSYRFKSGGIITIARSGAPYVTGPTFLDFRSGRFGPLFPAASGEFIAGRRFAEELLPPDVAISFRHDGAGRITGLRMVSDGRAETATRLPFRDVEVAFLSGDIRLSGLLTLPEGRGPHPAILLLHGSGPDTRDFPNWRGFFASQGLAVFSWDKRGVGGSAGDWKTSDFNDAAADALEALKVLEARSDIDPRRIGLWAISQGGWVAPIVATRAPEIAFVILHSGPATTPYAQGLASIERTLTMGKESPEVIAAALRYAAADASFTRTQNGWDELQRIHDEAIAKGAEIGPILPADSWFRTWYRRVIDFDPAPLWANVRCPVLAFFGERDANVPPHPNEELLRAALDSGGNPDVTTKVLPGASHGFLLVQTGLVRQDLPAVSHFSREYFDEMALWLGRVVGRGK